MQRVSGPADGPYAVVLPGTASTGDFVTRAFAPALTSFGLALVTGDPPRDGDPTAQLAALTDAAERFRPTLVGGVSLGAHLAVRWMAARAGRPGPAGMLLAMPAWTGAPDAIAAASATAAEEVATGGIAATLAEIGERVAAWPATAWVAEELGAAWPAYRDEELAAALRASATSPGPSPAELAGLTVPCGVVALRDDPLHPVTVARRWVDTLPCAALTESGLAAVGADRAVLGRGALLAYLRARAESRVSGPR